MIGLCGGGKKPGEKREFPIRMNVIVLETNSV